jgi:hypothetical protein
MDLRKREIPFKILAIGHPSVALKRFEKRYILFIMFNLHHLHITLLSPRPYITFTIHITSLGFENGYVAFPSPYKLQCPQCT